MVGYMLHVCTSHMRKRTQPQQPRHHDNHRLWVAVRHRIRRSSPEPQNPGDQSTMPATAISVSPAASWGYLCSILALLNRSSVCLVAQARTRLRQWSTWLRCFKSRWQAMLVECMPTSTCSNGAWPGFFFPPSPDPASPSLTRAQNVLRKKKLLDDTTGGRKTHQPFLHQVPRRL